MAVREFNGSTDRLTHSTGALSAMTYGTAAAIVKFSATGGRQVLCLHASGGGFLASALMSESSPIKVGMFAGTFLTVDLSTETGTWYLVVARKPTGTTQPRVSVYDFTAAAWTHGTGGAAGQADWTSPGASGLIRHDVTNNSDIFQGRMAVRGAWVNDLPWSADASGDTALTGAGLETSLQKWVDASADALWPYNQASTGTPVDDIVGAADQSSLTGTTVITGDDPPGFSFSLGQTPKLYVARSNLQLR